MGPLIGSVAGAWPRSADQRKREPFPSLSHLPKGAVVLARPPGLHMGETPPWRTDMDEDQKKRVAIFRFGVISDFFARKYMERGERERLLRGKCAQRWRAPFSTRIRLSRAIILGWVRLYRQGGDKLESLYPMGRNDRGGSRALDEDTAQAMVRLRRERPTASVTTLISEIMHQRLASFDVILKAPTVYRFLHQQELVDKQVAPPVDRRRCKAELPNDICKVTPCMGRC
ncbi:hypothetical protein DFAR_1340035 [Desulfarculales bacterium]